MIDGNDEDWPTLSKVKVGIQTSYGVYNDSDYVYLLLKTYDSEMVELISTVGHERLGKRKWMQIERIGNSIYLFTAIEWGPQQCGIGSGKI